MIKCKLFGMYFEGFSNNAYCKVYVLFCYAHWWFNTKYLIYQLKKSVSQKMLKLTQFKRNEYLRFQKDLLYQLKYPYLLLIQK